MGNRFVTVIGGRSCVASCGVVGGIVLGRFSRFRLSFRGKGLGVGGLASSIGQRFTLQGMIVR